MELKGNYNLPKKGSVFKTKNNFDNISFETQTIDKVNFKSVIITISGWFIVDENYKPTRRLVKLLEDITKTIKRNSNKHYFNGMLIDVAEIPDTFDTLRTGYVPLEYTIFINKGVKFNKQDITMLMNEMIDEIYKEHFKEPVGFDVYKSRIEFKER
jgi:hypothetical protein